MTLVLQWEVTEAGGRTGRRCRCGCALRVRPAAADAVKRLRAEGRVVAMVRSSDLTLVRGDPAAAADGIRLSRRTLRTIKGHLFWAFAYNVAAIPLAAAGLPNR